MSKEKMSIEEATKYYEDESKKMEIRAMCVDKKYCLLKKACEKKAASYRKMAENINHLWGKKYHTATRVIE